MRLADALGVRQVGDGARHAQDAVVGAARPLELFHRRFQARFAGLVRLAELVDLARGQVLVALALALQLHFGGGLHAGANDGGVLAVGILAEHVRFDGGHFHLHVDAIEQRAGDAALIALDQIRRAVADAADVAVVPARTRIHRRDQLEVCGKVGLPRGARDGDVARLHRLAQHVQYAPVELGH